VIAPKEAAASPCCPGGQRLLPQRLSLPRRLQAQLIRPGPLAPGAPGGDRQPR
jgi:hypothetical protein